MKTKPLPSQELLRQLLDYDPSTGVLTWRTRPLEMFTRVQDWKRWNNRFADREAAPGVGSEGYRPIRLPGGVVSKAHRVIWKWLHNEDPDQVDHQNGVRSDNREKNLRSVTSVENCQNSCLSTRNISGVVGVYWCPEKVRWRAQIKYQGKQVTLGSFINKDDATAARKVAEELCGFHPNHGRVAA